MNTRGFIVYQQLKQKGGENTLRQLKSQLVCIISAFIFKGLRILI